ncbi:MAG TPA: hypothetical protein VHX66_04605 [Solirubrobacteraceae bacterium]|jgi:hypothetical protein|nr:hypothetical protein [Solirubrobacteraceae bacterium]
MHDSVPPTRLSAALRARLPILAALATAALVAGCGGSSHNPSVASVSSPTTSTSSAAKTDSATASRSSASRGGGAAGSSPNVPSNPQLAALDYAECMRSHGVPKFPDPQAGGGFTFRKGAGVDPSSPLFVAAQQKCAKFVPLGGLAPGTQTHPSQQALSQMLKAAQCMRRHGISDFPEPRTSIPSNIRAALGAGSGVISDIEGVILVFPSSVDEQSPQFTRAASVCAFPLHNH